MRPVLYPNDASPTARFTATVVLPTPPFPEPTAIRFLHAAMGSLGMGAGWLGVIDTIVTGRAAAPCSGSTPRRGPTPASEAQFRRKPGSLSILPRCAAFDRGGGCARRRRCGPTSRFFSTFAAFFVGFLVSGGASCLRISAGTVILESASIVLMPPPPPGPRPPPDTYEPWYCFFRKPPSMHSRADPISAFAAGTAPPNRQMPCCSAPPRASGAPPMTNDPAPAPRAGGSRRQARRPDRGRLFRPRSRPRRQRHDQPRLERQVRGRA